MMQGTRLLGSPLNANCARFKVWTGNKTRRRSCWAEIPRPIHWRQSACGALDARRMSWAVGSQPVCCNEGPPTYPKIGGFLLARLKKPPKKAAKGTTSWISRGAWGSAFGAWGRKPGAVENWTWSKDALAMATRCCGILLCWLVALFHPHPSMYEGPHRIHQAPGILPLVGIWFLSGRQVR